MMGAWPTVDDSFPIGDPTPLRVDSSLNRYLLPGVSAAVANTYRNNNQGWVYLSASN